MLSLRHGPSRIDLCCKSRLPANLYMQIATWQSDLNAQVALIANPGFWHGPLAVSGRNGANALSPGVSGAGDRLLHHMHHLAPVVHTIRMANAWRSQAQ